MRYSTICAIVPLINSQLAVKDVFLDFTFTQVSALTVTVTWQNNSRFIEKYLDLLITHKYGSEVYISILPNVKRCIITHPGGFKPNPPLLFFNNKYKFNPDISNKSTMWSTDWYFRLNLLFGFGLASMFIILNNYSLIVSFLIIVVNAFIYYETRNLRYELFIKNAIIVIAVFPIFYLKYTFIWYWLPVVVIDIWLDMGGFSNSLPWVIFNLMVHPYSRLFRTCLHTIRNRRWRWRFLFTQNTIKKLLITLITGIPTLPLTLLVELNCDPVYRLQTYTAYAEGKVPIIAAAVYISNTLQNYYVKLLNFVFRLKRF